VYPRTAHRPLHGGPAEATRQPAPAPHGGPSTTTPMALSPPAPLASWPSPWPAPPAAEPLGLSVRLWTPPLLVRVLRGASWTPRLMVLPCRGGPGLRL